MIRYSVQPRDRIFLKDYGFLFFARSMGKNKSKNLSSIYGQTLYHAKQFATDALKAASKKVIEKIHKQLVIKLQEFQELHRRIIQLKMKKKYFEKDIYLQKKGRKLLMV